MCAVSWLSGALLVLAPMTFMVTPDVTYVTVGFFVLAGRPELVGLKAACEGGRKGARRFTLSKAHGAARFGRNGDAGTLSVTELVGSWDSGG